MFVLGGLGATAASCLGSLAATCACHAVGTAGRALASRSARLAYCLFFLASLVLAYALREGAAPIVGHLPWIARAAAAHAAPDAFFGAQAVMRVSLASATFFGGLAVALAGVDDAPDADTLQHGAWGAKLTAWLLLHCVAFFLPVGLVTAYAVAARLLAVAFLGIQVLLLLDGTAAWNDAAVDCGDDRALWLLLGATGGAYASAAALLGVGFHFFVPAGAGCGGNVAILLSALFAGLALSLLSISGLAHARGSLFPASAVSLYITYCAYSALVSEPHDYACNALGRKVDAASAGAMAAGVGLALVSVVYSALRAGSSSGLLGLGPGAEGGGGGGGGSSAWGPTTASPLLGGEELTSAGLDGLAGGGDHGIAGARALGVAGASSAPSPPPGAPAAAAVSSAPTLPTPPPPYSYAFFHAVFALASAYLSMVLTGWGSGAAERRLVDVGWASVSVKLGTGAATAALYGWTLVAPALLPDRFPEY